MRSAKREDLFPAWGVEAALSRLRGRQKKFAASPMECKHVARGERSWSYACVAAVNKMRYRHRAVFQEAREPDVWAWVIAVQKKKLVRRIDPVAAWRDAEYRILERYYGRLKESRWEREADRWRYEILRQRSYLRRLRRRSPGKTTAGGWNHVIERMIQIPLRRPDIATSEDSWAWQPITASQREKIRILWKSRGWENTLLRVRKATGG